MCIWKQWKKPKTRMRDLLKLGVSEDLAWQAANSLAYAGLSPSTYQSGQLESSYAHMEKRGSKYLRFALFMQLNTSATGIQPSRPILRKNEKKENTIT